MKYIELTITPEYIISQIGILTENELKALIENYGEQEYEKGSFTSFYNGYY